MLLECQQPFFDLRREVQARSHAAFDHAGPGAQFTQRRLLAIEPTVDTHVDEPADDAAEHDDHHAVERHAGVEGTDPEGRVDEDQPRPDDTHRQMEPEPPLHLAEPAHELEVLAQRIDEQHQHHGAADHGDPVAEIVAGFKQFQLGDLPGRNDEGDEQRIDVEVPLAGRPLGFERLRAARPARPARSTPVARLKTRRPRPAPAPATRDFGPWPCTARRASTPRQRLTARLVCLACGVLQCSFDSMSQRPDVSANGGTGNPGRPQPPAGGHGQTHSVQIAHFDYLHPAMPLP